jgi:hypothetical protein
MVTGSIFIFRRRIWTVLACLWFAIKTRRAVAMIVRMRKLVFFIEDPIKYKKKGGCFPGLFMIIRIEFNFYKQDFEKYIFLTLSILEDIIL